MKRECLFPPEPGLNGLFISGVGTEKIDDTVRQSQNLTLYLYSLIANRHIIGFVRRWGFVRRFAERKTMTLARMSRMVIGAGIGLLIGAASIAPLYAFIASVGMVPSSLWRNALIFGVLCSPLLFVGAVAERHEGSSQQRWLRRIIPFCLITAAIGSVLCAGPAFVANETKTDASVVCFLAFGWLSGMQGAFFILLARSTPRRIEPVITDASDRITPYW